jgi:hypothetical protein
VRLSENPDIGSDAISVRAHLLAPLCRHRQLKISCGQPQQLSPLVTP